MRKWVVIILVSAIILASAGSTGFSQEDVLSWEERSHPVYQAGGAYPRMYRLQNGTYLIGFDASLGGKNARIAVAKSTDGTKKWSQPVVAAEKEGYDCANANFIELDNGDILLAYRAVKGGEKIDAKILCSVSHDGG
ncbi:MAG: exo-alpha-sialidase, partial [Clostridia bacterium]|nr:exo-alpha-sialidase [Clostridia bacterium]